MRKSAFALMALLAMVLLASCNDSETYADQKKKERAAIQAYLRDSAINVISEADFRAADYKTDVSKNQYVLFENTGVYMQIQSDGCGEKIKEGETTTVLCRFTETNLLTDSIQLSNNVLGFYDYLVDKMTVTNSSGSFTASFVSGVMSNVYGNAVPSGWLVPLAYVKIGRLVNATDDFARVKLIVPHTQGQSYASQQVYPCLYEITYERGR